MEEKFIVKTTLSEPAYYRFRTWNYLNGFKSALILGLSLAYSLVIIVNIANIIYGGISWFQMIYTDVFVVIVPFIWLLGTHLGLKRLADNDLKFPVEYIYEFTEKDIIENDGERCVLYPNILIAKETKNFIYIVIDKKKGFVLTKNDFTVEITNKIKNLIVEKLDRERISFKK